MKTQYNQPTKNAEKFKKSQLQPKKQFPFVI